MKINWDPTPHKTPKMRIEPLASCLSAIFANLPKAPKLNTSRTRCPALLCKACHQGSASSRDSRVLLAILADFGIWDTESADAWPSKRACGTGATAAFLFSRPCTEPCWLLLDSAIGLRKRRSRGRRRSLDSWVLLPTVQVCEDLLLEGSRSTWDKCAFHTRVSSFWRQPLQVCRAPA